LGRNPPPKSGTDPVSRTGCFGLFWNLRRENLSGFLQGVSFNEVGSEPPLIYFSGRGTPLSHVAVCEWGRARTGGGWADPGPVQDRARRQVPELRALMNEGGTDRSGYKLVVDWLKKYD
jgi:hypothetical protein